MLIYLVSSRVDDCLLKKYSLTEISNVDFGYEILKV